MQIREIMTREVEVIRPEASVRDAAAKMKDLDVGAIPVCDGQKLQGVLTDRDIAVRAVAEGRDSAKTKVAEIMSKDLAYCFEDDQIDEAATVMEMKQIRRLPVLDRNKELVGIVSLGDISVRTGDQDLAGEALQEISEPGGPKR